MGFKLCTAEKEKVAEKIALAVGATTKRNGYYEGNGYIVTWAKGHLVGLAEPEAYGFMPLSAIYENEESAKKAIAELPIFPEEFKLVVIPQTKYQFQIVRSLMWRDDVDMIIDCGDMDNEGHILQWFIREAAGVKKPVLRFCATKSLTKDSIIEGMKPENLKDINAFMPLIRGEFCKKKEDWITGITFSRLLSLKYKAGINFGRVQTPTLYFVYKRWLDNKNFVVTDYYTASAELNEGLNVKWQKDKDGVFAPEHKDSENRVLNKSALSEKLTALNSGKVVKYEETKKKRERPQLFTATDLQKEANRKYGYSPDVTLATSEALYMRDIMSYPRTNTNYLTEDLQSSLVPIVEAAAALPRYSEICEALLNDGLNIDGRIIDGSKVTDGHPAIIPVIEGLTGINVSDLQPSNEERAEGVTHETLTNIFDLCMTRFLLALAKPYIYKQTNVEILFDNGMTFSASGSVPLQLGFKTHETALFPSKSNGNNETEDSIIPQLTQGQNVTVKSCEIIPQKTTPPDLLTYDTLLELMVKAGSTIKDGAILKGTGIGTEATRATIVKKLFDTKVVELTGTGKVKHIIPTQKGIAVVNVLPPDLLSPQLTADWEKRVLDIANGALSENEFLNEVSDFVKLKMDEIQNTEAAFQFKKERQSYGKCPWCNADDKLTADEKAAADIFRYELKNEKGKIEGIRFYCSRGCGYSVQTNDNIFVLRTGKKLTEAEAKKLIIKGRISLECKAQKTGNPYRGEFVLEKRETPTKNYCNVKVYFPNEKLKKS